MTLLTTFLIAIVFAYLMAKTVELGRGSDNYFSSPLMLVLEIAAFVSICVMMHY